MNNPRYLIIHHTGGTDLNPLEDTSHHTFDVVDNYHKSLGWGGCGYHYFIDKSGKITQGRKDDEEGAHCKQTENGTSLNRLSLGICMAGNFDVTLPTQEQIKSLTKLLTEKMKQYNIPPSKVRPHRYWAPKTCYGRNLSDDWLQNIFSPKIEFNQCIEEKKVIEEQKRQIWNLRELVQSIINYFK